MQFTGTVANVNAAINNLTYKGAENFNGTETLTILTSDLGATGTPGPLTDQDTVAITVSAVNDAPENTVPGGQTVNEDTDLTIGGISVADTEATTVQVTLSVDEGGKLTLRARPV